MNDELHDDDPDELDGDLGIRLRHLLDPSEDLAQRTSLDVDRALRGRSVLATALDLLGLGAWTARALLTDPPADADRVPEGR